MYTAFARFNVDDSATVTFDSTNLESMGLTEGDLVEVIYNFLTPHADIVSVSQPVTTIIDVTP